MLALVALKAQTASRRGRRGGPGRPCRRGPVRHAGPRLRSGALTLNPDGKREPRHEVLDLAELILHDAKGPTGLVVALLHQTQLNLDERRGQWVVDRMPCDPNAVDHVVETEHEPALPGAREVRDVLRPTAAAREREWKSAKLLLLSLDQDGRPRVGRAETRAQNRHHLLGRKLLRQQQDDTGGTAVQREERVRVSEDVTRENFGGGPGTFRQSSGADQIETDAYLPGTTIT